MGAIPIRRDGLGLRGIYILSKHYYTSYTPKKVLAQKGMMYPFPLLQLEEKDTRAMEARSESLLEKGILVGLDPEKSIDLRHIFDTEKQQRPSEWVHADGAGPLE